MFDFSQASLKNIIIHRVGTSQQAESLQLSNELLNIKDPDIKELLLDFFLKQFKPGALYRFNHESGVEFNPIFQHTEAIFNDSSTFIEKSQFIATILHQTSLHPNIKTGEFYVVYFSGCVIDDEITEAIGFFKSENKDTFLKIYQQDDKYSLDVETGINIKKLDKGCLIFNTERENGYKISIVDKTNKSAEAQYWTDAFLGVEFRNDEFFNTNNFIEVCKGFSDQVLTEENNFDKQDQLSFIKQSQEYFQNNKEFDINDFERNVIPQQELAEAFEEYKNEYQDIYSIPVNEEFNISKPALKKQQKYFKPVIKLDKNFHLYVHGKPEYLEKGFDEHRKMGYYKLFFYEEQ